MVCEGEISINGEKGEFPQRLWRGDGVWCTYQQSFFEGETAAGIQYVWQRLSSSSQKKRGEKMRKKIR